MEKEGKEVIFLKNSINIGDIEITDEKNINLFKRYKDYNTIRRSFRKIYGNIEKIIKFQENKIIFDIEMLETLFLEVVILYCRFFGGTKGKITLKIKDFDIDKKLHDEIICLRNKYFAHNEHDILGGDKIEILDSKINSSYEYNLTLSKEKNLILKNNIENIHNKIDGDIIPELEKTILKISIIKYKK